MNNSFTLYNFIIYSFIATAFSLNHNENTILCAICHEGLNDKYSVDAWGNIFHTCGLEKTMMERSGPSNADINIMSKSGH